MNSHFPTPSSGRGRTARSAATRSGGMPCMSERELEAYLLARDTVRRVQRTTSLVSAISKQVAKSANRVPGSRRQSH